MTSVNAESFFNALERFVNVRGRPTTIYNDNGTNLSVCLINWTGAKSKRRLMHKLCGFLILHLLPGGKDGGSNW